MMKRLLASALAGAFALAPMAVSADGHGCKNEVWNKVMSRGKIVVGVKADYKPWGYRDTSGDIVGMEIDMAKDVESYVHRIGRTGRAGATGTSITFWNPDYDKECAPALIKIARKANQPVPDWLAKFEHSKASKVWSVEKAEKEVATLAEEIGQTK